MSGHALFCRYCRRQELIEYALAIRVGVFYLFKAHEGYAVTDQF